MLKAQTRYTRLQGIAAADHCAERRTRAASIAAVKRQNSMVSPAQRRERAYRFLPYGEKPRAPLTCRQGKRQGQIVPRYRGSTGPKARRQSRSPQVNPQDYRCKRGDLKMAIAHLHARTVGKSIKPGRTRPPSAAAHYDYINRAGKYKRKSKEQEVIMRGGGNMPTWAQGDNTRLYWEMADYYERKNGRLYKGIEFSLPKELTADIAGEDPRYRAELRNIASAMAAQICARYATTKSGKKLPYTYAIHSDKRGYWHGHIMISERVNDGLDRSPDLWFRRAATGKKKSAAQGGAKKTDELYPLEWLLWVRRYYQARVNLALRSVRMGRLRIDMRSYADQGITNRVPQLKKSFSATRAEKNGYTQTRWHKRQELKEAQAKIAEIETQIEEERAKTAVFVGGEVWVRSYQVFGYVSHYRRKNSKKMIEYRDQNGSTAFCDIGNSLSCLHYYDKSAVWAAMQVALQKWGAISVRGDENFRALFVDLAVEHQVILKDPDLAVKVEERLREKQDFEEVMKGWNDGTIRSNRRREQTVTVTDQVVRERAQREEYVDLILDHKTARSGTGDTRFEGRDSTFDGADQKRKIDELIAKNEAARRALDHAELKCKIAATGRALRDAERERLADAEGQRDDGGSRTQIARSEIRTEKSARSKRRDRGGY